ncbi:hypothetical protein TPENAI_30033 [Tenacibaculum litopenaei]
MFPLFFENFVYLYLKIAGTRGVTPNRRIAAVTQYNDENQVRLLMR